LISIIVESLFFVKVYESVNTLLAIRPQGIAGASTGKASFFRLNL